MSRFASSVGLRDSSVAATGADRRSSPRKVLGVRARIRMDESHSLDADTIDLSSGGLSLTSKQPLALGQECLIELGISVPELASPPVLRAGVRYCAQMRDGRYRLGMKFTFVSIEAAELLASVLV